MSNKVLTRISTWFAYSDSEREYPDIDIESGTTSKWVENVGKYAIGKYLWVLWRYHYDDNSYKNSNPVCITGQPGIGVSIKQLYMQYYLSTSKTECIGGYWSNTLPTTSNQRYTWTRWYIEFDNGEFNYTDPMCVAGIEGPAGPQGESGVAYSSNLTKDSDQVFCRKDPNGVYVADGDQTITTILEIYENGKPYKIQESQLEKNPNVSNPTFKILDNGCVEVVIAYKNGETVYPSYEIKVKLSEDTYIIKNFIVYYRFGDYDYDLVVDKKVLAVNDISRLENEAIISISITEKYRKNHESIIESLDRTLWKEKGLCVKCKYDWESEPWPLPEKIWKIIIGRGDQFSGLYIYLYLNNEEIQVEYIEAVKNGQDGSFKSTVFRKSFTDLTDNDKPKGGNYDKPTPEDGNWSDGIPSGNGTLWSSTRIFSRTNPSTEWTTPARMVDTVDFEVIYSEKQNPKSPTNNFFRDEDGGISNWLSENKLSEHWTDGGSTNSIWMATTNAVNGKWSDWVVTKIKGEDGQDALSQIELHLYCKDPNNLTWSLPDNITSVRCNDSGTVDVFGSQNNYYSDLYWCSDKVDGIAYTCSASFGGTITNYDMYTKYTVKEGTIKFTEWTISDISYLQEAFGKNEVNAQYAVTLGKVLAVTDKNSNDEIVAGITNGSTITAGNTNVTPPMIFAGADGITNANDADFTVSKDGVVKAKKLHADVLYKTVVQVNPADWIKTVQGSTVNNPYNVSCNNGMVFNIGDNTTGEQLKILLPGGPTDINNRNLLHYLGSYLVIFLWDTNTDKYCININNVCLNGNTCYIFQCEIMNQAEIGQTGITFGFVLKGQSNLKYSDINYVN